MQVHVESVLLCSPEDVWREVCHSRLLRRVCWPLVTFRAIGSPALPEKWPSDETVRVHCNLLGVFPFGIRTIYFERIDNGARQLQSREHDWLIRHWDHLVSVRPHAQQTLYSDTVEIDAGWLTPLVWLFAQGLYRHRQRRWRQIARRLAATSPSPQS